VPGSKRSEARRDRSQWTPLASLSGRASRCVLADALALGLTACSTEAPPPRTAKAIVATIATKLATAKPGFVYTADTDPSHLLGQPNGYTSKATFTDSRINSADIQEAPPGSIQAGGSVEVFADASGARLRQQFLGQRERNPPLLGSEYLFTDGTALLRVSGRLTPAQAAEYKTAFES
jgi:hypothetical protein